MAIVGANAQSLAQRLDSLLLHDPMLKTSEVGIAVFDLTAGESLFQYQDELYCGQIADNCVYCVVVCGCVCRKGGSINLASRVIFPSVLL